MRVICFDPSFEAKSKGVNVQSFPLGGIVSGKGSVFLLSKMCRIILPRDFM